MKLTRPQLIVGGIAAAAAAVVGYLLLNGIIDAGTASALNVVIAGLAGATAAK